MQRGSAVCSSPYQADLTAIAAQRQWNPGKDHLDKPCIPYVEIEMVFPDGKRLCVLNLMGMQFGVQIEPSLLLEIQQAPTCLQPVFAVQANGRIVLHDDEDKPPPGDDDTPPGSGGSPPPTGPGGPPDDLLRRLSRDTYYVQDGNYYFDAKLDRYGTVHLNVKTKIDGVYGKIRAELEFKNMLDHFGRSRVQAIRGAWDAQAPGLTGNIELFNKLTAGGMSPEEAAFKIPTGRWAKEAGYGKIKNLQLLPPGAGPGEYDLVVVDFGH
jgi:hypothetical protein